MPQLTIVSKKTVASRFRKIALIAFLIGAGISAYPSIKYGINRIDRYLAYRSVSMSVENGYSESTQKLESVKDRLDAEQIAELEARLAAIHPDKLVLEAKNSEPKRKIELLGKACLEYKAIGQEKQEIVKDYAEASVSYIENQFNLRESSEKMSSLISELFDDSLIFHAERGEIVKNVKVDSGLIDRVINSEAGYIAHFFKSYIDDTRAEMEKKKGDVKSIRARVDNLNSIISNSIKLGVIFNPEKISEYVRILGGAYAVEARTVAGSNIDEENKLKVFVSLKRFEMRFGYKSSVDFDDFILNYVDRKID